MIASGGEADLRAPLASRNLAPAYANLGVPVMRSAVGLEKGNWEAGWSLHWASHSVQEVSDGAFLEYDGETQRQDLSAAVGLGAGLTLQVNLPWIRHDGGSLDSLIDGWHGFWGMPDGARDDQPDSALRYVLTGGQGFVLEDSASGIGDVEMTLDLRLGTTAGGAAWSAFVHYKSTTGELAEFTGSGEDAFALGLRYGNGACLWAELTCHLQVGVIDVGGLAYAPALERQQVFGGLSLTWTFSETLAMIEQLESQQRPFGSGPLGEIGTPVWGTLGIRWIPADAWLIEGQFSEDLNVASAPDITFRVALSRRW